MKWIMALTVGMFVILGPGGFDEVNAAGPRGLYVLSKNIKPLSERVFKEDFLEGISIRGGWSDFEPQNGQFRWFFDSEIERARKAGKQVILRVSAGFKTPDWVYQAGAQKFEYVERNPHKEVVGQTLSIPIPWDPIYLAEWTGFIGEMGRRYNNNDLVVLVEMVGPEKSGGEMHLPKGPEDKRHWQEVGYSKDKLVNAWKKVIDAYADAFPNKPLAIDVAMPVYKDGVVEEVLAYGEQRIGGRFCVQHNALAARTKTDGYPHRWVVSARGKVTIGFQLLCSATGKGKFNEGGGRFGGTLAQGLQIGLDAGAQYFEIYVEDLKDPASVAVYRDVAQKLRNLR